MDCNCFVISQDKSFYGERETICLKLKTCGITAKTLDDKNAGLQPQIKAARDSKAQFWIYYGQSEKDSKQLLIKKNNSDSLFSAIPYEKMCEFVNKMISELYQIIV